MAPVAGQTPEAADTIRTEPTTEKNGWLLTEPPGFRGGGLEAFRNWLSYNLVFPYDMMVKNKEGLVKLSFFVEKNGAVKYYEVSESSDASFTDAVLTALRGAPKWRPGKATNTLTGEVLRVRYSFPVEFRIKAEAEPNSLLTPIR